MFQKTAISLAVISLASMAQVAFAQEQAPAEAAKPTELEKVVVTSQKRKEDARKVPLSVSAIRGEALQANQVLDFTDLSRQVPNVSFSSQGGPGLNNIEIRGVSSFAGSATVGVYLDDVSLTTRNLYSQGTAEPRFFDLDRVEVLRGPQGTLYGAGSMGGNLRFISKEPNLKTYTTDILAGISNTDHGGTNSLAQAVINIPLQTNTAGLRIGVQTGHDSGYVDRVDPTSLKVIEKGINSADWSVLKLALKTDFGNGWNATPSLFVQQVDTKDIDASYLNVADYQANGGAPLSIFQTSKIVREPGKDRLSLASLTLNGDLGFAEFTGIGAIYDRKFDRTQDGTYINSTDIGSGILDPDLSAIVSGLPSAVYLNNKIKQESIELRLASKADAPYAKWFSWVGGAYLSTTKTDVIDNEPVFGINKAFQDAGLDIYDPANWTEDYAPFDGAFLNDNCYFSARHYTTKQSSVFGEGTYHFSPLLRLIAGLRYSKSSENLNREGDFYYAGGPVSSSNGSSASKLTPRISLSWDSSPETTVYATMAEGFRLGGANRPVPLLPGVIDRLNELGWDSVPETFEPDSLWSYELGSKSRLLDNRVSLNLAAYYIDWKKIQQPVYLCCGFDVETNVGNARTLGLEAELRARVSPSLTLNLSGGLTRAEFAGDVPELGYEDGVPNVQEGDPVVGVPEYNFRLGGDYRFELLEGMDSVLRMNAQWVGPSKGSIIKSDPDYNRPGYSTVDASWGVSLGNWDIALNIKNLSNNRTVLQRPNIQLVNQAYYLRPRTIGITASSAF
jgi:outer membrane receptor protein involved in Fe transport